MLVGEKIHREFSRKPPSPCLVLRALVTGRHQSTEVVRARAGAVFSGEQIIQDQAELADTEKARTRAGALPDAPDDLPQSRIKELKIDIGCNAVNIRKPHLHPFPEVRVRDENNVRPKRVLSFSREMPGECRAELIDGVAVIQFYRH